MADRFRKKEPKKLETKTVDHGYIYKGTSCTYRSDGSIEVDNSKITNKKAKQFKEVVAALAKSNASDSTPNGNKVYTFIFYYPLQPLYAAKELLDQAVPIDNLSVNYCSSFHKGEENDEFFSFDDISNLLGFNGDMFTFHQIPVLVCDKYKNHAKTN